jgi:hypothetical protein
LIMLSNQVVSAKPLRPRGAGLANFIVILLTSDPIKKTAFNVLHLVCASRVAFH